MRNLGLPIVRSFVRSFVCVLTGIELWIYYGLLSFVALAFVKLAVWKTVHYCLAKELARRKSCIMSSPEFHLNCLPCHSFCDLAIYTLKFFCCKRNKNLFLCLILNSKVKHIAMQLRCRMQSGEETVPLLHMQQSACFVGYQKTVSPS